MTTCSPEGRARPRLYTEEVMVKTLYLQEAAVGLRNKYSNKHHLSGTLAAVFYLTLKIMIFRTLSSDITMPALTLQLQDGNEMLSD